MSAVRTEAPPTAPAGRFGGLLRAEAHRFVARRFIQVLLLLAALGWVTATVIGLTQFASATPERLAAAQQELQEEVERSNAYREECLASDDAPADISPEEWCGTPVTAADLDLDWYLDPAPFSLAASGTAGAVAFGAAGAVLAFLVGATFVGAEWSSRSMVALLFWETRRPRVLGAKIAVVAVASAVLGVVAQAAWLATAGLWQAFAGDGAALPDGFWPELLATGGRGVLLTTLVGLLGFGLTNLVRNTGAALGVGFVYFAVLETAVRAVRPEWQPWLLTDNAAALVMPDGLTIYTGFDPVTGVSTEYLLGNLQAGVFLAVVAAVVLTVGIVLFTRRDLH
ncbi:ABC transporter permease subunit [Modestobacter sp. VKM Ac-2984]|uniref:ABC transporter permease subunit n=1 Tax=Modestobacter sp. VKM Ac-2984 TaxID=3004138 RepID=UPI0022AB2D88|nr:ABC transporter permease subunit [Modestobacter sp. VKM Ac-2984]MCZ2818381.1 ABC transporter permease subunit [Modestobacter sp. VKM Ac-2984]